ncbi:hypothetical protein GW835_01945 [archaeon]|jgi:hypothetical protein|nr:hypothetical protein [archaeon]NCP79308.1 hypothetical protein [archaeon]NCP98531.1 hypothetical protein [archaeon]NCQ07075.1 hypothetical protein [archaeon]NCQ50871.1 hypothetical protein [archaeon]
MVGFFKRLFSNKKPVVSIGNINPNFKVKRRVVNQGEKQLKVLKINSKTQFYSVKLNKSEVMHLSVLGKKLIKEYPELVKLISKGIFQTSKHSIHNTKKFSLEIRPIKENNSFNNLKLLKLNLFLKDKGEKKSFFLKVTQEDYLANNEFLANQVFQKFGVNTIKPHFAFTNLSKRESVIVYDFTGLKNLQKDFNQKLLTKTELIEINNKIKLIQEHKKIPTKPDFNQKRIGDFENFSNIFYKRNKDGKIELYFTDLLLGVKSRFY